jgi:DNA-binding CsgD family transcriptional regulator
MLVFGTQMHIVTFLFVCIELVILFYLIIYRLARPDDTAALLDIILIALLLTYNITGGLLPDPNLPGSYFIQESIAYGTGFITPCYFPFYVYKGFGLKKMKFHAFKGVFFFLMLPYFTFVFIFFLTGNLNTAKNLLFIPVLYALWVLYAVWQAIHFKYSVQQNKRKSTEEVIVLFISLTPWVGLPFIAYFDLSQAVEAITTNTGFLLLLGFHLKRNVEQIRDEHSRLIESEKNLLNWNERLQQEVDKRTKELEKISAEERLIKNCKAYCLTNRETEIAQLICNGVTYKQIAETLFIAERTVAKHAQNIFEKVSVNNKLELCNKLEKHIKVNATKPEFIEK